MNETPLGYCHCGCGGRTPISQGNCLRSGWEKGKPKKFIQGHGRFGVGSFKKIETPNPSGLCMCGCGQRTPIATRNKTNPPMIKGQPLRYLPHHCNVQRNFKGGRILEKGYVLVLNREHPRARPNGYVPEHILLAEKAFGGPLPEKTVVHHHTPEQLVVCQDQSYHILLHTRERALRECGHASWRKCHFCKKYDDVVNLIYCAANRSYYHRLCHNEYQNMRYRNKKQRIVYE